MLKRVRLTRDILLDGRHVEEGSIHYLPQPLADHLIAQDSAVHLNLFSRCLQELRFFFDVRRRAQTSAGTANKFSRGGNHDE
jgi:hypothetical protein